MSSDDDVDDVDEGPAEATAKGGSSKSLGLRFQKKFLGMSVKSKGVAKNFLDDTSGSCAITVGFIQNDISAESWLGVNFELMCGILVICRSYLCGLLIQIYSIINDNPVNRYKL